MPPYAGPLPPARAGEVVETLRLMAYLVLALVLIVLDHRGGWLSTLRTQAETGVQPLRLLAGWPGRVVERLSDDAGTLSQLTVENQRLRNALLVNQARMARMQTVAADNTRLRALLDAAQRGRLDVQLAPILDVDLDPTRQRLLLDAGSGDGVRVGQTVLDAGGLVGQVIDTGPLQSTVLLLTDASHAVPVSVARSGVRLVAYGDGRSDRLLLPSVPTSGDVKVGDVLVTSGLGRRFEAGFPVGTITALRPDDSRAFLVGEVRPAAQFDRGREVLLLRSGGPVAQAKGAATGATAAVDGVTAGQATTSVTAPAPDGAVAGSDSGAAALGVKPAARPIQPGTNARGASAAEPGPPVSTSVAPRPAPGGTP